MNKKKLIWKLAWPAAIIAGISLIGLLALGPIRNARYDSYREFLKNKKEELKKHIELTIDKNQKEIQEIAAVIKSAKPDQALINKLQTEFLADRQKPDRPKKYLWMSTVDGDFIFGVPEENLREINYDFDLQQIIDNNVRPKKSKYLTNTVNELKSELHNKKPNQKGVSHRHSPESSIDKIRIKYEPLRRSLTEKRIEQLESLSLKTKFAATHKLPQKRNDYIREQIDRRHFVALPQYDASKWDKRDGDIVNRYLDGGELETALPWPQINHFEHSVYNSNGKKIAQLFFEVDDKINIAKYRKVEPLGKSIFLDNMQTILGFLLAASVIFLWFLLPTWVYLDASERNVKSPILWAFLSLISLFIGLAVYLITRPEALRSLNCPECGGELDTTRIYCPHCGKNLSRTFCQQCQYPLKPEWKYCPNCRTETGNNEQPLKAEGEEIPQRV
jgi:hypothetical protein